MSPYVPPLVALVTLVLVWRFMLWRAVLFMWPQSLQLETDEPAEGVRLPDTLAAAQNELLQLGFERLGSHVEKAWLMPSRTFFDYVHRAEGLYASLVEGVSSSKVSFWSENATGALVVTGNYPRLALEIPRQYLSGALEEASVSRVFRAHLALMKTQQARSEEMTQEARLALAQRWLKGPGRRELRWKHVRGWLWSLASLGMLLKTLWDVL